MGLSQVKSRDEILNQELYGSANHHDLQGFVISFGGTLVVSRRESM